MKSNPPNINKSDIQITEMYVSQRTPNVAVYFVYGVFNDRVNNIQSDFYNVIKIDMLNKTFKIILQDLAESKYNNIEVGNTITLEEFSEIENSNNSNIFDFEIVTDEEYITIFTNKNTAKRLKFSELEETGRAKRGNALMKRVKSAPYSIMKILGTTAKTELTLITEDGKKTIKNSEIPIMDLASTGSNIGKKNITAILKNITAEKKENELPKEEQQTFELNDFKL